MNSIPSSSLTQSILEATCMTYEAGSLEPCDFPDTDEPVWILGKKYSAKHDLKELRRNVHSKLWMTYRRNFPPIGDTQHTSDKGWGCMLRCGQMVVAQSLICHHLGRNWLWNQNTRNETYLRILAMFADARAATYSIHQIATMGVSEGKEIGEWFGPNTVGQVLRKLSVYDEWTSLVIHVALDSTMVIDDIKLQCQNYSCDIDNGEIPSKHTSSMWRPLLLIIPLRLGLSELNPIYIQSLKTCLMLEYSVGMIGGRPNHALYFIGFMGNQIVFLDPHTTQPAVSVGRKRSAEEIQADETYHFQYASRMDITQIDPSLAVCFCCRTEQEFDLLCRQLQKQIIDKERQPLFEICKIRPSHWGPPTVSQTHLDLGAVSMGFEKVERHFDDSDDEFEIIL